MIISSNDRYDSFEIFRIFEVLQSGQYPAFKKAGISLFYGAKSMIADREKRSSELRARSSIDSLTF